MRSIILIFVGSMNTHLVSQPTFLNRLQTSISFATNIRTPCNSIQSYYSLDDGSFFLVAAKTAVNFIARLIFPLIFNIPFINACCGCTSFLIILPITSSEHVTIKSAFPSKVSPFETLQEVGEERSRLYVSPPTINITVPYIVLT